MTHKIYFILIQNCFSKQFFYFNLTWRFSMQFSLFILMLLIQRPFNVAQAPAKELILHPLPPEAPRAADFRVWIDGQELDLLDAEPAAIGRFDFRGEVEVRVAPTHDVKWVDIRPLSRGVNWEVENNLIRFTMREPADLSVELNGRHQRVLYLFSSPPEEKIPDPEGPGVRYFAAGKIHDAGQIDLSSGETLYIEGGAIVRGLTRAHNAKYVAVKGRGIIDLSGIDFPTGERRRAMYFQEVANLHLEGVTMLNSPTWTVELRQCRAVNIDRWRIVNWATGSDGIDLVSSSEVHIQRSFVRANDDCIVVKAMKTGDPLGQAPDSRGILVEKCALWNMAWGNALEIGFELRSDHVEQLTFRDCDILHVDQGAAISIHNADRAAVREVLFDNIRVENARHKLFDLAIFYSRFSADYPHGDQAYFAERYLHGAWDNAMRLSPEERLEKAQYRGRIQNLVFRDIAVVDGPLPFSIIAGYDENHRVENVVFENLTFHGRKITEPKAGKFWIENAENIVFR
jgi:hypothetical protein